MPVSRSLLDSLKKIIPPLDGSLHKGQSGRVGVGGGIQEYALIFAILCLKILNVRPCSYTSALFFAAVAASRTGADLSHVTCAPSAANANDQASSDLKSYAPELIVHPIPHPPQIRASDPSLSQVESELSSLLSRLHVLVIGPGLGSRDHIISHSKTVLLAKENGMYVVLDADAL